MADKVVKYNFLGAGLTYLLTGSFLRLFLSYWSISPALYRKSLLLPYLTAIKRFESWKWWLRMGVLEKYLSRHMYLIRQGTIITVSIVERVLPFGDYSEENILTESVPVLRHIYHPIANAIVKAEMESIWTWGNASETPIYCKQELSPILMVNRLSSEILSWCQDEQVIVLVKNAVREEYKNHCNLLFLGLSQWQDVLYHLLWERSKGTYRKAQSSRKETDFGNRWYLG